MVRGTAGRTIRSAASSRYHRCMGILFGFHAVTVRLKTAPRSVIEVHIDATRRDARMRAFVQRVQEVGATLIESDDARLGKLSGTARHQGVVARVTAPVRSHSLDDTLDEAEVEGRGPVLLLVLDGVTDPHNLGACLRVADAAGAHAVVAPKDRACGLNATAIKVASGAADSVPYLVVTNLARSLREMKERDIWVIGADGAAQKSLYAIEQKRSCAWVLGAEGDGMRRLTRETCDELARIPMLGSVESLNVSVSAGICLFETRRKRSV